MIKNKVLILFPYSIGNFYLLLAALKKYELNYQNFEFLVEDNNVKFLINSYYPKIRVYIYKKTNFKFYNYFFFVIKLLKLRQQHYNKIISLHFNSYTNVKKIIKIVSCKKTFGFSDKNFFDISLTFDNENSELENYSNLLKKINFLKPIKVSNKYVVSKNKKNRTFIIGLHVGSSKKLKYKRWSLKNYLGFINMMNNYKKNCLFILFGGPEDILVNKSLLNSINTKVNIMDLTCKTNINITEKWVRICDFFISSDSGLSQMANFFEIPTFTLIGPTSTVKNKSANKKSFFIESHNKNIFCRSADNFMCKYCYNEYHSKNSIPKCLKKINHLHLLNKIKTYLNE